MLSRTMTLNSLLIKATLMAEDKYKVCFKCGLNLPLSEFYKHPQMADGHLNKCKACTKKDAHENYMESIEDPKFIDKERARNRDKYNRLYRGKARDKRLRSSSHKSWFERRQVMFWHNIELHHWNYDKPHDVFLLSRQHHARLHKLITRNATDPLFTCDGVLLDTKEKHEEIVKKVAGEQYFYLNEETLVQALATAVTAFK